MRDMPEAKTKKIAPGIYEHAGFTIMKVDKGCWRITNKGYGNDFDKLTNAIRFIKKVYCHGQGS